MLLHTFGMCHFQVSFQVFVVLEAFPTDVTKVLLRGMDDALVDHTEIGVHKFLAKFITCVVR